MKRLIKILALIPLFALILLVAVIATRYLNAPAPDPITTAIEQQLEAGKKQIALAELTDFEWDTVVILGPYSPAETANKALGFTWSDYHQFDDALISEVSDVMVFAKAGKVVKAFVHPRYMGDFTEGALDTALTPKQAVFEVIPDSKEPDWKRLQLVK